MQIKEKGFHIFIAIFPSTYVFVLFPFINICSFANPIKSSFISRYEMNAGQKTKIPPRQKTNIKKEKLLYFGQANVKVE